MIELNVPRGVRGVMTTREGGISKGMYGSFNLGTHVDDDPVRVEHNRARLAYQLGVELAWMNQVHGTQCAYRTAATLIPTADAQWTEQSELGLCVGVADCLPVGLVKRDGSAVAVAHAQGVQVDAEALHKMIDFAAREHRFHQPSMLQDVRADRETEIESLNGFIVNAARRLGIAVPRNELIYGLVLARQAASAFWKQQPKA